MNTGNAGSAGAGFREAKEARNVAVVAEQERVLEMWRNVYRFYMTFRDMRGMPEDWIRCGEAAVTVDNSFHGDPLGRGLLMSVYDWLGEQQKKRMEHMDEEMRIAWERA